MKINYLKFANYSFHCHACLRDVVSKLSYAKEKLLVLSEEKSAKSSEIKRSTTRVPL